MCWNRQGGPAPPGIAELGDNVWQGDKDPSHNGTRLLGTPLGTPEFAKRFCTERTRDGEKLAGKAAKTDKTQHAWLLQNFCLVPRINHLLRQVPPSLVQEASAVHDRTTQGLLEAILSCSLAQGDRHAAQQSRLPSRYGALGLRDSKRTSHAAYRSSWAGVLPFLDKRFPTFAAGVYENFSRDAAADLPNLVTESHAARNIIAFQAGPLPSWDQIREGLRPARLLEEEELEPDPGEWKHGWRFQSVMHWKKQSTTECSFSHPRPARPASGRAEGSAPALG